MSNLWNKALKPIVVLSVICIVVAGALAFTNELTAPIIDKAAVEAATKARIELFPDANDFTKLECDLPDVTEVYRANGVDGMIVTATGKGYGGAIKVLVAFEKDGTIRRVKIEEQNETPGVGSKITFDNFWDSFTSLPAEPIELSDINAISGATISSKAVVAAVNAAITAFSELN